MEWADSGRSGCLLDSVEVADLDLHEVVSLQGLALDKSVDEIDRL